MPFTVNGYIDGVSYQATVGGEPSNVGPIDRSVVTGSPNALALLTAHEGQSFSHTVTGDAVPLDLGQSDSILAALRELTEVTSIDGDVPEDDDFDASVIY